MPDYNRQDTREPSVFVPNACVTEPATPASLPKKRNAFGPYVIMPIDSLGQSEYHNCDIRHESRAPAGRVPRQELARGVNVDRRQFIRDSTVALSALTSAEAGGAAEAPQETTSGANTRGGIGRPVRAVSIGFQPGPTL